MTLTNTLSDVLEEARQSGDILSEDSKGRPLVGGFTEVSFEELWDGLRTILGLSNRQLAILIGIPDETLIIHTYIYRWKKGIRTMSYPYRPRFDALMLNELFKANGLAPVFPMPIQV